MHGSRRQHARARRRARALGLTDHRVLAYYRGWSDLTTRACSLGCADAVVTLDRRAREKVYRAAIEADRQRARELEFSAWMDWLWREVTLVWVLPDDALELPQRLEQRLLPPHEEAPCTP